jgi:hypothetical protein
LKSVIIYDPDWYLLEVPAEFHSGLVETSRRVSEPYRVSSRPHISVMKDEARAATRRTGEWSSSASACR